MCPRNIHVEAQCYDYTSTTSNRGTARPTWNRDPQVPFAFFFRSAHHFRFASLKALARGCTHPPSFGWALATISHKDVGNFSRHRMPPFIALPGEVAWALGQ